MTIRELYALIINSETMPVDAKECARAQIEALDKRNAHRAEHDKEKRAVENAPYFEQLLTYFEHRTSWALASEIAVALGVSSSKATALAKSLVADGSVEMADVKVKGKGVLKGYRLIRDIE